MKFCGFFCCNFLQDGLCCNRLCSRSLRILIGKIESEKQNTNCQQKKGNDYNQKDNHNGAGLNGVFSLNFLFKILIEVIIIRNNRLGITVYRRLIVLILVPVINGAVRQEIFLLNRIYNISFKIYSLLFLKEHPRKGIVKSNGKVWLILYIPFRTGQRDTFLQ